MRKKIFLSALIFILCFSPAFTAYADVPEADESQYNAKSPGWHVGKTGRLYYIGSNGKRVIGWKKIDGKFYFFNKKRVLTPKTGWVDLNGRKYYIRSDHTRCEGGMFKIAGKYYYFNVGGALVTNREMSFVDGKYYDMDSSGVATEVPSPLEQCKEEAAKFVERHTSPDQSDAEMLRSCFDYLINNMTEVPAAEDQTQFSVTDWKYRKAVSLFRKMRGDNYDFSCALSACAKVIGYRPVLFIAEGHSYVKIINGYFDGSDGGTFGAKYPPVPEEEAFYKSYF